MQSLETRLFGFLFPRSTDIWLAIFRLGLGLEVTLYSISLRKDWSHLLSGTVRKTSEALLSLESHFVPRLGWFVALSAQLGVREERILFVAWICLFASGCALLVGVSCRFAAIAAWLLHLCAAKTGTFVSYGMDNLMTIGLFYLMLSPLPDRLSFDSRSRDLRPKNPQLLGFWRRVLQLHLCFIYFFSGLTKCLGSGWWDGLNVWRALIRPPFNVMDPEILVRWSYLFPMAGILICLLEFGYPFFIWSTKTRKIWLLCVCAMHVAIAITMGMYLFSLVMIVLNMAAFAPGVFAAQNKQIRLQLETAVA